MSTKEWLMRAWKIDNEIAALEKELTLAKERALSVTSRTSDIKVQTSGRNSTEDAIHKYIEYQEKLNKRLDKLFEVKNEIIDAITRVDNTDYRTLLELRYLRFMTWEKIAEEMDMSDRWVRSTLHRHSLEAVSKIIFR